MTREEARACVLDHLDSGFIEAKVLNDRDILELLLFMLIEERRVRINSTTPGDITPEIDTQ